MSSIVVMFFMYSSNPSAIAVEDLDGDGVLDLAVANRNSNDVSVLLVDGNGAFVGIAVNAIRRDTGEDGTQAVITLRLTSKPTDDVTIDVSSSDETEGTVDTSYLIFTTGNWNAYQEVTVTGEDDDEIDGDQRLRLLCQ